MWRSKPCVLLQEISTGLISATALMLIVSLSPASQHQSAAHVESSWRRGEEKKNTGNVLAIYSSNNLTAELQLVQRSQHPLATVRSPHQVDHEHLHVRRDMSTSGTVHTSSSRWALCVCVCVKTSSNPILLGFLGGTDRKLECSKGGFCTLKAKEKKKKGVVGYIVTHKENQ